MTLPQVTPEQIHEFWFGELPSNLEHLTSLVRRHGPPLDEEVRRRFTDVIEAAFAGAYEEWTTTPRGLLALILVVDQLPRHAFRGTAHQYDGDARALSLAMRGFELGWEAEMEFVERMYLCMPLSHTEDIEVQRRHVVEADRMSADAPDWIDFFGELGPRQSRKYLDVIERFGRFPHRNSMLNRASTPEEVEFLKTWAQRQAPDVLRERGLIPG